MRAVQDDYVNVPTFTAVSSARRCCCRRAWVRRTAPRRAGRVRLRGHPTGCSSGCRSSGCSATLAPSSAIPTMRNHSTTSAALPRRCGSGRPLDGGGRPTPRCLLPDARTPRRSRAPTPGPPSRSNRPCMPAWFRDPQPDRAGRGARPERGVARRREASELRDEALAASRALGAPGVRLAERESGTGKRGDPPRGSLVLQQAVRLGSRSERGRVRARR